MATREQMVSALRGAHEAGDTEAATRIAGMLRTAPAAPPAPERPDADYGNEGRAYPKPEPTVRESIMGALETLGTPFARFGEMGADVIRHPIKAAGDLAIGTAKSVADVGTLGDRLAYRAGLYKYHKPETTPTLDKAYDEAGPIAAVGRAAVPTALMGPLSRFGAVADIAGNAALGGVEGYASGEDPTTAALTAAGGATVGRVLARTLTGAKTAARPEARQLIDRGVTPSPAQLFDGPVGNVARSVEDKLTSLPIVGDVLTYSRGRTIGRFGNEAINDALGPLAPVSGPLKGAMDAWQRAKGLSTGRIGGMGDEAVEAAQRRVSAAYDSALDGMRVEAPSIRDAMGKTVRDMIGSDGVTPIALLDKKQAAQVAQFMDQRIRPLMAADLDGAAAKRIDSEIGHYARKYSRSPNPGDHPMGDAFYALQTHWRTAMTEGTTGEASVLLNSANKAYMHLLPIVKAADRAAAHGGKFTPHQLNRAATSYRQEPTALTDAAQAVLPSRVPDSGTTGRMLLNVAAGGGAAYAGIGTAAATALGALAYSPAGMRLFARGIEGLVPNGVYRRLQSLPPEHALGYIGAMVRNPYTREATEQVLARVASQIGRQQTQPEGATP
jgi:hypothetical protein